MRAQMVKWIGLVLWLWIAFAHGAAAQDQDGAVAQTSMTFSDCIDKLSAVDSGWCEMRVPGSKPGISAVWPDVNRRIRQVAGPSAVLTAWNSAAYDPVDRYLYFMGGGHADYGGNEVYRFELDSGTWRRLTDPSPLDYYTASRGGHSFWIPDTDRVPGAFHTYDGLLFLPATRTLLALSLGPANGARVDPGEPLDRTRLKADGGGPRQYEFNPSLVDLRNGLPPLQWRLLGTRDWGYPRSAVLPDNTLVLGSKTRLYRAQLVAGKLEVLSQFSSQADSGDGTLVYDAARELLWSMHAKVLLAFARTGRLVKKLPPPNRAKSIAISTDGRLVTWDGGALVSVLDPDDPAPHWSVTDWGAQGPTAAHSGRVYEKWQHVGDNLFVGVSTDQHGVWLFKLAPR
ncbi:MAG: hypothetical protein KDI16_10865 [Halioglobus sp.]|nr:hypothetical protein [Halioglobus sp.]